MSLRQKILVISIAPLVLGCASQLERGAVSDGGALGRGIGTAMSGAVGLLAVAAGGGGSPEALLGGVTAAAAAAPMSSSSSGSSSSGSDVSADESIAQYACYYDGQSYGHRERISSPDTSRMYNYGRRWDLLVGDGYQAGTCECGAADDGGWGCVH